MGHETVEITFRYYSKIPAERVCELFDQFDDAVEETMDDKELMLRLHEGDLEKGTPDWRRAQRIITERRARMAETEGF